MTHISQTTSEDVDSLAEVLTHGLRATGSLEEAAQWFTEQLTARFPSIVLARVFATMPYFRLPVRESSFARRSAGEIALLPSTEILTLLGSSGAKAAWNERLLSRSHLTIPLFDRARVEEIPMVSRLLGDLRFRLQADTETDPLVTRAFANANGLFFVDDATTALDDKGRNIVPASGFVRDQQVRCVFGFGGSYVLRPMFVATILFTRERVTKQTAMQFIKLSSTFKAGTTRFVTRGQFFDGERTASSKA